MPRKYRRKTNRADINERFIKCAIKDYSRKKCGLLEACRRYGIKKSTLQSRIKKLKSLDHNLYPDSTDSGNESENKQMPLTNKYSVNQVFAKNEELELAGYLKTSSDLGYGLTYRQIRILAYDFAKSKKKLPKKWESNEIAGLEWMKGFMSRHTDLSLRKPENTSIFRATAFNKDRVMEFFDNYAQVLRKYSFKGGNIYNLDETGISTVLRSVKVVTTKGKKQVGQVVSGERGELVTFLAIVNGQGGTIPPVYVYPHVRDPEQYFGDDGPEGSLVLGNKSGWMNSELFMSVLKHIANHTKCSVENRILLILDNHKSHISIEGIQFCREKGISLLSFPPHTTHRLQPLDVGLYAPFKNALSIAYNDWMLSHPGRPITIRNIASLSCIAYKEAFTLNNITSSFKKPGIWPVNRLAFTDNDFIASSVTNVKKTDNHKRDHLVGETDTSEDVQKDNNINLEEEETDINEEQVETNKQEEVEKNTKGDKPSSSKVYKNLDITPPSQLTNNTSLTDIRPLPKFVGERKKKNNRKYESKSRVYTFTPEYKELENEIKRKREIEIKKNNKKTKRCVFKEINYNDWDTDLSVTFASSGDESSHECDEEFLKMGIDRNPVKGEFVLVRFYKNKKAIYYVAEVLNIDNNDFEVKFYRKSLKKDHCFVKPTVDDISTISESDIRIILPNPVHMGATKRQNAFINFGLTFNSINIR